MNGVEKQNCPQCKGNKTIEGTCECNMEWRGTQMDDTWEDCRCTPDIKCPTCGGKGYLDDSKRQSDN